MKKQFAILGLVFFLALSGRAYQLDIYDTYLGYKYCVDSRYCVAYGNNLVFLNMSCYGGSNWDVYSGNGILFFDLVYNIMKIIVFYDAPSYESVVIESYWPEIGLGKEAEGYLGVGSFGESGTWLWIGDVRNVDSVQQELEKTTPISAERSGRGGAGQDRLSAGNLGEESDTLTGILESSSKSSYLCRLVGYLGYQPYSLYYAFYVYDYAISLASGVTAYPIIAQVWYNHYCVGTTDGLIFIKSQNSGYLSFSLTLFENSIVRSVSFTEDWFNLSTSNEMYLILRTGETMTVRVYLD